MQRRRSGIYEFRQRLPQQLAGMPAPPNGTTLIRELINPKTGHFKRELVKSLGTQDYGKAKRLNLREAQRVNALYDLALSIMENPDALTGAGVSSALDLNQVELAAMRMELEADEQARRQGDSRKQHQTPEERAALPLLESINMANVRGLEDSGLIALGVEVDLMLDDHRTALARRDITIVRPLALDYLRSIGQPTDPTSEEFYEVALAFLRGTVRGLEGRLRRQGGEDVPTPKPAAASESLGPKLSEALDLWKAGSPARGSKKPAASTVREAERATRYLTEWHGDIHVAALTKEMTREFRNALARLPTRLVGKERQMTFRQIIEATDKKGAAREIAHAGSVNKLLNLLSAIVNASEREGLFDKCQGFTNPFSRLSLTIDKRNVENRRRHFKEDELATLLGSSIFTDGKRPLGGGGEAAYWFPLISLLSGARLNEITQLRLMDIREEEGIWVLDIGTDGGRAVKTVSSRRLIPLHPELIRLGLLDYRKKVAAKARIDTATLWPDVRSENPEYRATAWSKFFNRHLRKSVGLTDPGLVFHSFRHTFKRHARNAHLGEELHDALTGHTGSGSVGRGYGDGFSLQALATAMGQIEFPQCVRELEPWLPRPTSIRPSTPSKGSKL